MGSKTNCSAPFSQEVFKKKNEREKDKEEARIEDKKEGYRGAAKEDKKESLPADSHPRDSYRGDSKEEPANAMRQSLLSGMGFDEKVIINMLKEKMFSGAQDDSKVGLLNSMKPFLSEKRQKGIDDCIKLLSVAAFFGQFKNKQ